VFATLSALKKIASIILEKSRSTAPIDNDRKNTTINAAAIHSKPKTLFLNFTK
jgi:hypothetical protein